MAAAQRPLRFFSRLILALSLLLAAAGESMAQTQRRKAVRPRDTGQPAIVIVDGAAIYEKANFDAPVMDYLERGKKVLISKRIYRGAGGLGAFYKIKIRRGIFGYITDVDVQIDKAAKERADEARKARESEIDDPTQILPGLENPEADNQDGDGVGGPFFTRYLGVGFNQYGYAETIAKNKKSSNTSFMSLKMSGPGKGMGGMPLDFEFSFTTSAPSFYGQYFGSSKGFLLLSHAMTILPLKIFKESMFYYGFGLVGKYSKFDVSIRAKPGTPPVDSQDLAMGLGGHIGYMHSFSGGKYAVRLDGKYYYEKESYFGYGAALQMKF